MFSSTEYSPEMFPRHQSENRQLPGVSRADLALLTLEGSFVGVPSPNIIVS